MAGLCSLKQLIIVAFIASTHRKYRYKYYTYTFCGRMLTINNGKRKPKWLKVGHLESHLHSNVIISKVVCKECLL